MKKTITLLFSFLAVSLLAQETVFKANPVGKKGAAYRINPAVQQKLDEAFKNYELYTLDGNAIHDFAKGKEAVDFKLELGKERNLEVTLLVNDLRSPNYQMVVLTDIGEIVMPRLPAVTYKGWANHDASQYIRVSIYDGTIKGYIMQDGEELFIEPVHHYIDGAASDLYMVYKISDVTADAGISCGATELIDSEQNLSLPVPDVMACKEAEIALACDKSFTTERGSPTAASTEMNNILNLMDGKYGVPAIDISYKLVKEFIVDINGTDPWSASTTAQTLLQSFQAWGNGGGFGGTTYDMANLWTNRNILGSTGSSGVIGLAYIGVICSAQNRYGLMEHFGAVGAAINYVDQTHECGHMWSAQHSASNSSYIMSPSIGNSNIQWDQTTINSITSHKNSRTCLANCTTTGISEKEANDERISISPNPGKGVIRLELNVSGNEDHLLEVRNLLGEIVYSEKLNELKGLTSMNLDMSRYEKGCYILSISSSYRFLTKKIILE